jgi:hypothetical protein
MWMNALEVMGAAKYAETLMAGLNVHVGQDID